MSPPTITSYRLRDGLSQITALVDSYWERRAQLEQERRGTYHSEFYDLPGVADVENPETPIYLLSQLWSLVKLHDEQARLVADGWKKVTKMAPNETQRHKQLVAFFCHFVGEGSYQRHGWADARLHADSHGKPDCLLPKGRRTRGVAIGGKCAVYVRDVEPARDGRS
jgi:hypothetical protein